MDNRLFIKKCYFCGEPSTEENLLYEFTTNEGYELCHEGCRERKEENEKEN